MKIHTFDKRLPIQHRAAIFTGTYILLQRSQHRLSATPLPASQTQSLHLNNRKTFVGYKGWFTLYVTLPFRRGTSPFSKIISSVFKRICSHWQERLRQVSVPFRRHHRARMFDGTERVRTGLNQLDSDVNSPTFRPVRFECLLVTSAAWLFFGNGWKINRIGA
jgi:hypothetical protein